ncbi:MAG: dehydrogenase, partial [Daejeonella sp.]|nr:dehydrogenase [Daejeonella sp.]
MPNKEKITTNSFVKLKKLFPKKSYIHAFLAFTIFTLHQCQTAKRVNTSTKAMEVAPKPTDTVDLNVSKVISAEEAIGKMHLEAGFEIKLVAAEPLISTPVAMTFDNKNRMWVLEMSGYMPDTLGTGEDKPSGKVVILEDKNNDGVADERKVFLDSLRMPRALCLVENGILVAEPPFLWYYEINNDKPGKKTLVDNQYAIDGNVEHQPNGLLRSMDNWIYNAKSSKRYRKEGNRWIIERTHFRGQWGISQDNYGRLFYNDNSANLLGDNFPPGLGSNNKDQRRVAGYVERTVPDNRVYPARPTTGVNRGYIPGVLDDSLRLVNFTAACGPLIYRGNLFGSAYEQNAFVAEPSANLIKRNILSEQGYLVKGVQAYKGREFLASVDERFRPVSLYDGPDGALYVVDMYRGIIQHKTYLSTYLKKEISKRNLELPLACGRIYKIVPKGKALKSNIISEDPQMLVELLGDPNGWIRDKAQQMLVDRKGQDAIPALRLALKTTNNTLKVIHALWTLEGLHALRTEEVLEALNNTLWPVRMQALSVIPSVISKSSYKQYVSALEQLALKNDDLAAPYIAFVCNSIQPFDKASADNLLKTLVKSYASSRYVSDAVISNLQDREAAFQKEILILMPDTTLAINKQLKQVQTDKLNMLKNSDPLVLKKAFPRGAEIFNSTCQTCHGADGNGIKSLAPPLNKSEWINGDQEKLISIVLFGLTGPVEVNGHLYEAPEITADMPGVGGNKEFSDSDIAQLLSYLRRSWQNNAIKVTAQDVTNVRTKLKDREQAFTMQELNKQ